MRMLLYTLLFLLGGGATALFLRKDSGYALLSYDVWTIEMSLAMLVLLGGILFVLLYAFTRLLLRSLHLPRDVSRWKTRHGAQLAQRGLTHGLTELAEGNWSSAEKQLLKHIEQSETPLLNYLSAARAAQLQGEHERQDHYIRLAHHHMPSADIAVSLTQAELQLASGQLEQALATLQQLRKMTPRHSYVLRLLARVYEKLGDWEQLNKLLPALKRGKVEPESDLAALEIHTQQALLKTAAQSLEPTRLDTVWNQVPRNLQKERVLITDYAEYLHQRNQDFTAEALIHKTLKSGWDESLIALYGQLQGEKPTQQLKAVESLLEEQPRNPVLLLALGRLSLRAKLWGKARSYLEASIGNGRSIEAARELGHLLEAMGEQQAALDVYRQSITDAAGKQPVELPKSIGGLTNQPPLDDPMIEAPPPHGAVAPEVETPAQD